MARKVAPSGLPTCLRTSWASCDVVADVELRRKSWVMAMPVRGGGVRSVARQGYLSGGGATNRWKQRQDWCVAMLGTSFLYPPLESLQLHITEGGRGGNGVVTESEVVTGYRALVLQLDGPELCKEAKVVVVVTVMVVVLVVAVGVVPVRIRVSRVMAAGRRRRRKGRVRVTVAVVHPEGAELAWGSIVVVFGGDDGGSGGSRHAGWSRANRFVEPD